LPLPIPIGVVLYHGPDGAWTAACEVKELYTVRPGKAADFLRGNIPHLGYRVEDLTRKESHQLEGYRDPLVSLTLLALRYSRAHELVPRLATWRDLFAELLGSKGGDGEMGLLLDYFAQVGDELVHKAVDDVLRSAMDPRRREEMMRTWAENLIEQGMQRGLTKGRSEGIAKGRSEGIAKGRSEGIAKGRAQALLRLLDARGVHVDTKSRRRILCCTKLATLDRWFDRALKATRLADVLADPGQ
jgi:hypothetical protein